MKIKDTNVPNRIKIAETIFHIINSVFLTPHHQFNLSIMNVARLMSNTNIIVIEIISIDSIFR